MRTAFVKITLDDAFRKIDNLIDEIMRPVNEAATGYGLKCIRFMIRKITPPLALTQALEMLADAECKKRAKILVSEGVVCFIFVLYIHGSLSSTTNSLKCTNLSQVKEMLPLTKLKERVERILQQGRGWVGIQPPDQLESSSHIPMIHLNLSPSDGTAHGDKAAAKLIQEIADRNVWQTIIHISNPHIPFTHLYHFLEFFVCLEYLLFITVFSIHQVFDHLSSSF